MILDVAVSIRVEVFRFVFEVFCLVVMWASWVLLLTALIARANTQGGCDVATVTSCPDLCDPSLRDPIVAGIEFTGVVAVLDCLNWTPAEVHQNIQIPIQ